MRGCACKTCEGQRAYNRTDAYRERHRVSERARVAALDEASYARIVSIHRNYRRRIADQRDASQLRGAL